jgi:colicin import membrane protein
MENRSLSVVALLSLLLAQPVAALAADAGRQAGWQERLGRAAAMQEESKGMHGAASKLLEQKNLECAKEFLVNACRNEAYQAYLKSSHEARRLENDGKALEREVKKEQAADRRQRVAEEAPQRAAERREREAETAAARQAAERQAEKTRADKARQAVSGERRKAREAERLRRKQAAHAARVAQKKQETERKADSEARRRAGHEAAKAAANR